MVRSSSERLERQDAGEGNIEPKIDGAARQVRAAGVTVQHGGEGALPHFLLQDLSGVGVGVARMDDQRQPGLARGRDVIAKAAFLRLARALVVEVVEPGFADRDDFRQVWSKPRCRRCRYRVLRRRDADGCRPSRTRPETAR